MQELRQNPATREWVIIATERRKRPDEFRRRAPRSSPAEKVETCPFCPGNEGMTPPEEQAYRTAGTQPNTPGWWVRVVSNRFAALHPEGNLQRTRQERSFFLKTKGIGKHEVVIETPGHNEPMAFMEEKQLEEIILTYRDRYLALSQDPRFKLIIIFKNHGERAGTSLEHPHSQIVATPIVPLHIRNRLEEAMRYYDDYGACVYCDMLQEELSVGERIVMETAQYVVFNPFASQVPFETWIIPRIHSASFANIGIEEAKELGRVLKAILSRMYHKLQDPDFNLVIHTAPIGDEDEEYYHWYLQILPRLTTQAGFEIGSGIYINHALPEETALFLRDGSSPSGAN